ncbi:DUF1289 domain-containing protein [Luteimonas weifangensis]|uniref:DUF1289 domain-containing protein n=1 Tax=Cognatiluteimonas weifangensis TaxID=2303539 RepID=A0A372DLK2_9GAMM|nr:DUF1289 domain-containing protein [Luteimonas weifangensis]
MTSSFSAVLSPCIGLCRLGADGLCEGCRRSAAEIAAWSRMGDEQRLRLLQELPARAAAATSLEGS